MTRQQINGKVVLAVRAGTPALLAWMVWKLDTLSERVAALEALMRQIIK